jgi:serine/threonine protein kinase
MEIMLEQPSGSFDAQCTRLCIAEVALALEYLFTLDIVYRDVKPENILISSTGHVKVVDFGFAKRVRPTDKCWTMCGTAEYMSPETIMGEGQDHAVDWWALGVLAYVIRCDVL